MQLDKGRTCQTTSLLTACTLLFPHTQSNFNGGKCLWVLTHDHDGTGDAVQQQECPASPNAGLLVAALPDKQGAEEVDHSGNDKGSHQEQQQQVYHNKPSPAESGTLKVQTVLPASFCAYGLQQTSKCSLTSHEPFRIVYSHANHQASACRCLYSNFWDMQSIIATMTLVSKAYNACSITTPCASACQHAMPCKHSGSKHTSYDWVPCSVARGYSESVR